MKKNKIGIIIPYFGKFPNYFDLFLNSCMTNKEIDFLIFTDNQLEIEKESNIHFYPMTLDQLKTMFEEKLQQKINVFSPYKLCDYKSAYGMLFDDYLRQYDFWGYCDVDLIFGDIMHFLKWDIIQDYEKIQQLGHLTLYKNNDKINHLFLEEREDCIPFKKAIQVHEPCYFDECSNIKIFEANHIKVYESKTYFDCECTSSYLKSSKFPYRKDQIILWDNGKLYQKFLNSEETNEMLYIHFQKRKFPPHHVENEKKYYIASQGFFDIGNDVLQINQPDVKHVFNFYKSQIKKISVQRLKIKLIVKGILSEKWLKVTDK